MDKWSNLEEYEKLSKERLIELVGIYGRLALTMDGLWFLGAESLYGIGKAIELDEEVWRRYGRSEARRLKRFLGIDQVTTLDEICKVYLLTPVFGNMGARAEIREGKCCLSITDCQPQKARTRRDLGQFACKPVGVAYFEGLLTELNPGIRFRCIFCPPDEHPEDTWCSWEAWFSGERQS